MFRKLRIENPKRDSSAFTGRASWYPYYAGFSPNFAHMLLASSGLPKNGRIVDPWNGSGTTTAAAADLGYRSYGYDLNPVMVLTAKARLLSKREIPSVKPLVADIIRKAKRKRVSEYVEPDPLCTWLVPGSAEIIRTIEQILYQLLVEDSKYVPLASYPDLVHISDIASFFYTALFRVVRNLLSPFIASNPTWIKNPRNFSLRLQPPSEDIIQLFIKEVSTMTAAIDQEQFDFIDGKGETILGVASSDSLPVQDQTADLILSSPPYCTRIDYAVATMPELAVLGYHPQGNLQELRRRLIGTSTVPKSTPNPLPIWGPTCNQFLNKISLHKSKASKSY